MTSHFSAGAAEEFKRGWHIVVVSAIGLACGLSALPIYSLGAFTKPLGAEFGWNRAEVQAIYTWFTIGNLVASPLLGWVIDRYGVRTATIWSIIGQGIGFIALGTIAGPLWSFYLIGFITAVIGVGTVPITWTRVVIDWFDNGRGVALGLALAGTGVSATFVPSYTTWLLQDYGWQTAYIGLGVLPLLIALPISYLWLSDRTGGTHAPAAAAPAVDRGPAIDFRAALAGYRFWIINASFFLIGMCVAALIGHMIPMLTDRGVDPVEAARVAGLIGAAVIVGRVITGFLIDRFWAPAVALILLVLPAGSCVVLATGAGGVSGAMVAAVLLGLAAGAEFDLMAFMISQYFGQRSYGIIYSVTYAVFKIAAGIGPLMFGYSFDTSGSYSFILYVAAAMLVSGSVLLLTLGSYLGAQHAEAKPAAAE
jgi:MFS family permease